MIENPAESLTPEALARLYLKRVYGFCRSMLRNERDAEDACQEVFLTVLRRGDQLGTVRRPLSWLMKVSRLTCLWVRRKRRTEVAIEEAEIDAPCDPGPPIEGGTERGRVQEALERLPERYQAVLTMHYQQGMSQEEIADAMELSRGALRVLLHRAVLRLRQEVKK
ncbi:MAG: sigma-70 family RNA polymerase sigma factor [Planctomycetaceae bacterium]|nr:sigma-70 family RNA polymerase sigma factor [Planctomycetaceae bacterium]